MSCFNRGGDCKPCYERNLASIEVARTGPAWPVSSKCTPGCADCDVPQPEPAKGQPEYEYIKSDGTTGWGNLNPPGPKTGNVRSKEQGDIERGESAKWVPKAGEEVLYDGDRLAEVLAVDGSEAWLKSRLNGRRFNYCVASLHPRPAREVRKQCEWQHKSGKKVWIFATDGAPFPGDEWTPTGRTHSYEVGDE